MPIIVNPSTKNPPPTETITSPDGRLTATRIGGGTYLLADFDPNKVVDPDFTDPALNTRRFGAVIASGRQVTFEVANATGNTGPRWWLIGDKAPATSSDPPTAGYAKIAAGQSLAFAIMVRVDQPRTIRLQINWQNRDGTQSGNSYSNNLVVPANEWTKVALSITAPADAVGVYLAAFAGASQQPFTLTLTAPTARNGSAVLPQKVRFTRYDVDGDPHPVRSGTDAWAVGGVARAFDREAGIGEPSRWMATAFFADGTTIDTDQVSVTVPDLPYGPINCVITSINDPVLSRSVIATDPLPEFAREDRSNLTAVQGGPFPAGGWDLHTARATNLNLLSQSREEQAQIEDLLTAGPVFVQFPARFQIRPFYALPGSITMTPQARMDTGAHAWAVSLTEIERPDPTDAPLIIPGRSYADTHRVAGTYQVRRAIFPTYADATNPEGVSDA